MHLKSLFLAFAFTSLLCSVVNAQSQNTQIVLYKDFFFLNTNTSYEYLNYERMLFNDHGYAVAFHREKDERMFRQWEVKLALDNSSVGTREIDYQEYQVSYRRGKYWEKPLFKSAIRPRHSVSAHLNYIVEDSRSPLSSEFPIERTYYGIGLDYAIGMEFSLFENLNLHIDCNLISVDFGNAQRLSKDPTLTLRQQQQRGFNFDLKLQRILKLGLGIQF